MRTEVGVSSSVESSMFVCVCVYGLVTDSVVMYRFHHSVPVGVSQSVSDGQVRLCANGIV